MRRRGGLTLTLLFAAAGMAGTALAASPLTDRNSINPLLTTEREVQLSGPGCGASGSATITAFPAGATSVNVLEPKVGDVDQYATSRVTEVRVAGTQLTLTAVGDGTWTCGTEAGSRPWSATYFVRAQYRRRFRALIRVNFNTRHRTLRSAPRTVFLEALKRNGYYQKVAGLRWTRFGSRRAVGRGVLRNNPPSGLYTNKRVRVVASRPFYCERERRYVYLQLNLTTPSGRPIEGHTGACR